jgi:hypothetical protein
MTQYQRKYRIVVDTIEITDLDVQFRVEKSLEKQPNKASVTIYNLNEDHRKQLTQIKKGPEVTIEAGYKDDCALIFAGQLHDVSVKKENVDWITELRTGDKAQALASSRTHRSYEKGAAVDKLIKDVIDDLGVGMGNTFKALLSGDLMGAKRTFTNGVSLSGPSARELDRLLSSIGKEWSVQDGEMQIIDRGSVLLGAAIQIDPEHGLIGSPIIGNDGMLKITTLLNPLIIPGRLLMVESADIKRAGYRVCKATFNGDFAGQTWYTEIEAKLY